MWNFHSNANHISVPGFSRNALTTGRIILNNLLVTLVISIVVLNSHYAIAAEGSPYPPSTVIKGLAWDFSSHVSAAPGSDLWPTTWAADDNIYAPWGDGGGFNGNNSDGRALLGLARIEGSGDNWQGFNVFGGVNAEAPATFPGKVHGVIAIDGSLYMYVTEQDQWMRSKVGRSDDNGRTWTFSGGSFDTSGWDFAEPGGAFAGPAVVQYGRDYAGAAGNFVYLYSERARTSSNNELILARAPKDQLQNRAAYEFFSGKDDKANPLWSSDITKAQAIITDPNGINWGFQAMYHPILQRYLLTTRRKDSGGGLDGAWAIFDAPHPWGPWTTVAYYDNWDAGTHLDGGDQQIMYSFPTKWISDDGKTMWMIFSISDSFNVLKATLTFDEDSIPPAAPSKLIVE